MNRWLILGVVAALMLGSIVAMVFMLRPAAEDYYSRYPHDPFYISISADGNYIAASYRASDGFIQLFGEADNVPLQIWLYPSQGPGAPSISAAGDYITVDTQDGIYLFSRENDEPLWSSPIYAVQTAISSDGSYIAAKGGKMLYLFSFSDNSPRWSYEFPAGGAVRSIMSSDGTTIVALFDGQLYFFGRDNNVPKLLASPNVYNLDVSANGNYVAMGGWASVYLLGRENGLLWSYLLSEVVEGVTAVVGDVAISADGNYIVAGGSYAIYPSWDFPEGGPGGIHLFSKDGAKLWLYQTSNGWDGYASIAISDNGGYIAVGDMRKLYLFGNADNVPLWTHEFPEHVSVESVSISSDGNFIAVGTEGGPAPNVGGSVYLFDKNGNILWSYHHEVKPYPKV